MTPMTAPRDRAEIADLFARLAHAQDDKDWAGFRELFAERVRLDLSGQSGAAAEHLTAGELTATARSVLDGFACTHHATSNLLIETAGATAIGRAHVVAYHQVPTTGVDYCVMRGYWRIGLVRERGRWAVADWAIVRTAPWEGDPDVYRVAALRVRADQANPDPAPRPAPPTTDRAG
jgi:SnoaL-like protein